MSSDRQWLTDRVTKQDISNDQKGFYAQTTTPVAAWLDVVLAGRLDFPKSYDKQWSPKAGVVVKPMHDQAFRVTFNRAFKSPTILQTNFFIPDWTSIISVYGNTDGFTVKNAAGTVLRDLQPDSAGIESHVGVRVQGHPREPALSRRHVLQLALRELHEPARGHREPVRRRRAATYAYPTANPNGMPTDATGKHRHARAASRRSRSSTTTSARRSVSGVDLGANFVATDHLELRGTLSTVKLSDLEVPAGSEEATALNSPGTKWTLGASATNVGPWSGGLTFRNVNAYYFRSGTNVGVIPTFGTLDASVSFKMPQLAGHAAQRVREQSVLVHGEQREVHGRHDAGELRDRVREPRLRIQRGRTAR